MRVEKAMIVVLTLDGEHWLPWVLSLFAWQLHSKTVHVEKEEGLVDMDTDNGVATAGEGEYKGAKW